MSIDRTRVEALTASLRGRLMGLGGDELFTVKRWYQVTAALDSLEDTSLAIECFLSADVPTDWGRQYLRLFGMLVAVGTQQDAVRFLYDVLAMRGDFSWARESKALRDVRSKAVVHSAQNGGAVARRWIAKDVVPVLRWVGGEPKHDRVNLRELLNLNRDGIIRLLELLLSEAEQEGFLPAKGKTAL